MKDQPAQIESGLLRPAEAMAWLRISRSLFYSLVRRGKMPGVVRVGKLIRVSRAALERMTAGSLEVKAT